MKSYTQKGRTIYLPAKEIIARGSVQKRLAIALENLPEPKSRRRLVIEVPRTILRFEGRILLPNGMPYPRHDVDRVMGHESGRQLSMFMTLINGELRYKPRPETLPRLVALYCYVDIEWPHIAGHIIK